MNFDQWWATLTIKEQTTIGKNNARFVWVSAVDQCARACDGWSLLPSAESFTKEDLAKNLAESISMSIRAKG